MKIKFNTKLVVNIFLVGLVLLFTSVFWLPYVHLPNFLLRLLPYTQYYTQSDDLKAIDTPISTDISYSKYIKLRDSTRQMRDLIDGNMSYASGWQFGYIAGTEGYYMLCDTCTLKGVWNDLRSTRTIGNIQYYIKLPGWKIKDATLPWFTNDSVKYYVDHKQAYIRKTIIDSVIKTETPENRYKTHLANVPVKFIYLRREQCIAIPVNRSTKNIMDVVLIVFGILLAVYMLCLIGLFLKFVIDLSKGFAFTDINIARLKFMAISLLAYPLATYLINYGIRFLFSDYFTTDVVLSDDIWSMAWKTIVIGIVFLLLYRAFRQGKILKEEQDLTV